MKIAYTEWNPSKQSKSIVRIAESIIDEYMADGYELTLRQLYYQFVSKDLIENSEASYKRLGSIIQKAREAGMLSWEAIEDRTRNLMTPNFFETQRGLIRVASNSLKKNPWINQDNYVEVWVEKEALAGVVDRACTELRVPYICCRGYMSSSEAWNAGQRVKEKVEEGYNVTILHLGDHDPSGMDMTKDNANRIFRYSEAYLDEVDVKRIALNMDQIAEYDPPPNPAKLTDSRAREYIKRYGKSSWELDALPPAIINELIQSEVRDLIDIDAWHDTFQREEVESEQLKKLHTNWDQIKEFIDKI